MGKEGGHRATVLPREGKRISERVEADFRDSTFSRDQSYSIVDLAFFAGRELHAGGGVQVDAGWSVRGEEGMILTFPLILKFSWKVVCESHSILTIEGVVKEWVVQPSSPGLLDPILTWQQRGCW